jgi:hypothetical protein
MIHSTICDTRVCLSICLFVCLWLYSPSLDPGRFFKFLILYTVGRTPWTEDHPVTRPLPTHKTTQTQNKRAQTSMPRVGFEPTIPVLEQVKIVHALDCAATVIGIYSKYLYKLLIIDFKISPYKLSQNFRTR